jgi:hypothetical protein
VIRQYPTSLSEIEGFEAKKEYSSVEAGMTFPLHGSPGRRERQLGQAYCQRGPWLYFRLDFSTTDGADNADLLVFLCKIF